MSIITVIGRGHSGTRAISQTLSQSGVYMGDKLNRAGDLIPPEDMYNACRIISRYVTFMGGVKWDFSRLNTIPIEPEFINLIKLYLSSILKSKEIHKGWKLPETTLVYPWIVRLYPNIKYILWVRDPRDSIIGSHLTDDLKVFGIDYKKTDNIRKKRAISWKYQREIIKAAPVPRYCIKVRFEDFVLKQDETLARLENFLGIPLVKIPVWTESIGRWRTDDEPHNFDFLMEDMKEEGYIK